MNPSVLYRNKTWFHIWMFKLFVCFLFLVKQVNELESLFNFIFKVKEKKVVKEKVFTFEVVTTKTKDVFVRLCYSME